MHQRETASLGGRVHSGLQHLRPSQLQPGASTGAADPAVQSKGPRLDAYSNRRQQARPQASPHRLQRGRHAPRPVLGLRLLRDLRGRDVPWGVTSVPRTARADPGGEGDQERTDRAQEHRQEHVGSFWEKTDRLGFLDSEQREVVKSGMVNQRLCRVYGDFKVKAAKMDGWSRARVHYAEGSMPRHTAVSEDARRRKRNWRPPCIAELAWGSVCLVALDTCTLRN